MKTAIGLAALMMVLAPIARADSPLQQALAKQDGPLYAFDLKLIEEGQNALLRIDPAKPKGSRITVKSPAPDKMSKDLTALVARMEKSVDGDIWCNTFADNVPADAKLISDTGDVLTYGFSPVPGKNDKQFAAAFKNLVGEIKIDKINPAVLSFQMTSPKPFKAMAVARIETFDMRATCMRGPDGRTHIASLSMKLLGSAMMQPLNQNERQEISNLALVAPSTAAGTK
jgi:hypothetical protein